MLILKQSIYLYKKYEQEEHNKFCSENQSMRIWNKNNWEKHPVYEYSSHSHGKGLTFDKYWACLRTFSLLSLQQRSVI